MKVLILGARAPACLEWARAFHESGAQVWVADSQKWPLSRFSKSVVQFLYLPEPKSKPLLWGKSLQKLIATEGISLLIPTCEEVFYLSAVMEKIDLGCRVLISAFPLLQKLHHKGTFAHVVAGLAVTTPETYILESKAALAKFNSDATNWVFKPAYSRFAVQTLIKPSSAELQSINPSIASPWVAQKFVPGKEYCSFSLLHKGKLTVHACYQPRYRVGKGSGIYFDVVYPRAVQRFVEDFGARTGYTGQVGFDFIEDADSVFFVLECNPRATSGVHLFDDQRVALVESLNRSQSDLVLLPSEKPRMVGLAMLLFAATKNLGNKIFWQDFQAASDVVFNSKDIGPLLGQIPGFFEISARALTKKCGLLSAATADIEWDGQTIFLPTNNLP